MLLWVVFGWFLTKILHVMQEPHAILKGRSIFVGTHFAWHAQQSLSSSATCKMADALTQEIVCLHYDIFIWQFYMCARMTSITCVLRKLTASLLCSLSTYKINEPRTYVILKLCLHVHYLFFVRAQKRPPAFQKKNNSHKNRTGQKAKSVGTK